MFAAPTPSLSPAAPGVGASDLASKVRMPPPGSNYGVVMGYVEHTHGDDDIPNRDWLILVRVRHWLFWHRWVCWAAVPASVTVRSMWSLFARARQRYGVPNVVCVQMAWSPVDFPEGANW